VPSTNSKSGSAKASVIGTVRVGELDIAHEAFGSSERPTILLVMGLATQLLGWPEPFCELLVDQGFHVVRFDNRDVGLSTHLDGAGMPNLGAILSGQPPAYRLDDMADDTVGLLDGLGIDTAHLVGASMGGMIAQAVAIRYPERVRSLTSIMSTPGPHAGRPTPEAEAALLLPPPKNREAAARRAVEVFRVIGSPGYPLDEQRVAETARLSYDRAHDPAGVARQLAAVVAAADRTPRLREVRVPTLVVHGEDDPLIGVDGGRATAEAVPGSRLLVFPGMGHDLPEALYGPITTAIGALAAQADVSPSNGKRDP